VVPERGDHQRGSFLGPSYGGAQVRAFLDGAGAVYHHEPDEEKLLARVVREIAEQKVVGFVQGRMEFGPRALGSRSILGDARSPKMQSVMNLKIKFRESFRPFAPMVLQEDASRWFTLEPGVESPYMLLVAHVRPEQRVSDDGPPRTGLERLSAPRSTIPAVTHVDHSARVQTVDATRNPRLHRLLTRLRADTGCPVLINTSFNIRGEPIVCSPEDAYRCFMACDMDVLVLEDCVLYKSEQPAAAAKLREEHLARFQLD
jgi:carbamoyltransferase